MNLDLKKAASIAEGACWILDYFDDAEVQVSRAVKTQRHAAHYFYQLISLIGRECVEVRCSILSTDNRVCLVRLYIEGSK